MENRGRGGVGELREDKAKLMVGSAWTEESCSGWLTVSFKLVGAQAVGGGVPEVLGRERARQGGENDAGLLQVLGHALVGEPRLCAALATAAARWQPRGWPGWRGGGREAPARGKEGGVESGRDAWETTASRRLPGPSTAAGGAHCAGGAEAEWERGGKRKEDLSTISENSRDPIVKQQ